MRRDLVRKKEPEAGKSLQAWELAAVSTAHPSKPHSRLWDKRVELCDIFFQGLKLTLLF